MNQSYSPMIISDKQRIQQIILNLQSNALKFTEMGHVTISCKIYLFEENEDSQPIKMLEVQVQDSGIGISTED